ncbi:MAG: hypothetical protein K2H39_03305 [Paramuribaculum sp.]|nr:hypothetical protein [Paramuribaculum sp.]
MSLPIKHYKASFIMRSKDESTLRIVDLWTFKSTKSNKRYIVEVERFSNHFLGLKFYWKGVADSKKRYSLLTNDFEPRTIVMSCVYIMLKYFRHDEFSSFGFVAANDINQTSGDNNPNKRFRFYRRMMLSIFGSETFAQGYDINNSIYILLNKKMIKQGNLSIERIEAEISELYEGEYTLVLDS